MNLIQFMNARIKKMDWIDVGLVKWSCMFFGILLAMLFPGILNLGLKTVGFIILILAIRPIYRYLK